MAINFETEDLIRLDQRGKLPGPTPTYAQLRNWIDTGIKDDDGKTVWLESIKIGGDRFISIEGYRRFVANLNHE